MAYYNYTFMLSPLLLIFMDRLSNLLNDSIRYDIKLDKQQMRFESNDDNNKKFDFVIVGGGSAGCALASRLSEKYEVLLLEMGGYPSPFLDIPAYAMYASSYDSVGLRHKTVPQRHSAFGLTNHAVNWPTGKQLGGSSNIGTLTYSRGNIQGFKNMSEELGHGIWSVDHILKYYEELENYEGFYKDDGNHGRTGSMRIERSHYSKFIHNLLEGGAELGYPVRDPNIGPQNTEGFSYVDSHMHFGRRQNAYREFIWNSESKRSKLTIRRFSTVTKVDFVYRDGKLIADGVSYQRHRKPFTVKAGKEVILCAGALGTAKLLMLSGIGPKEDLEKLGIKSVVDLPVGQSLQDRYGVLLGPFTVKRGYSFRKTRDITLAAVSEWLLDGTGPIASSRIEATYDIISNYSKSKGRVNAPDLHVEVIAASADSTLAFEDLERSFNLDLRSLNFFEKTVGKDSFMQAIYLHSPQQTGYVKLRDSHPQTSLEINPGYLETSEDLKVLVEGMRFAIKVAEEPNAMKQIFGKLRRDIKFPGCEAYEFTQKVISDEYLKCIAEHATISNYRYCGTAPIDSNDRKVVSSDFRLNGVDNLRVVDASVLQLKWVSVTDATIRMLGLLASEVIENYWNPPEIRYPNENSDYTK